MRTVRRWTRSLSSVVMPDHWRGFHKGRQLAFYNSDSVMKMVRRGALTRRTCSPSRTCVHRLVSNSSLPIASRATERTPSPAIISDGALDSAPPWWLRRKCCPPRCHTLRYDGVSLPAAAPTCGARPRVAGLALAPNLQKHRFWGTEAGMVSM